MNESPESRAAGNSIGVTEATGWLRDHSRRFMTVGVILALLYLERSVLIPLALGIMLSLLVAPFVRGLRRIRVGRTPSVLIAVVALIVSCTSITLVLGTQILHIAESLPQYESNVQGKLKTLEEVTVGPILRLTKETSRLTGNAQPAETLSVPTGDIEHSSPAAAPTISVLSPEELKSHHPLQLLWKLLTTERRDTARTPEQRQMSQIALALEQFGLQHALNEGRQFTLHHGDPV